MLIQVSEAATKLGVSRQTLENWGKAGILNIVKRGHAHWVYSETIEQMKDTPKVIEETQLKIQSLKKSYQRKEQELEDVIKQLQSDIMFYRRTGCYVYVKEFYLSIPDMLYKLGAIGDREKDIIKSFIEGRTIEEICLEYRIQRERTRQIFYKAIRKGIELSEFADKVKEANDNLDELRVLRKRVRELEIAQNIGKDGLSSNYINILRLKIKDEPFTMSDRLRNVLISAGVEDIYDLLHYNLNDLMKFRNMGRSTLSEVEQLIKYIKTYKLKGRWK